MEFLYEMDLRVQSLLMVNDSKPKWENDVKVVGIFWNQDVFNVKDCELFVVALTYRTFLTTNYRLICHNS